MPNGVCRDRLQPVPTKSVHCFWSDHRAVADDEGQAKACLQSGQMPNGVCRDGLKPVSRAGRCRMVSVGTGFSLSPAKSLHCFGPITGPSPTTKAAVHVA